MLMFEVDEIGAGELDGLLVGLYILRAAVGVTVGVYGRVSVCEYAHDGMRLG